MAVSEYKDRLDSLKRDMWKNYNEMDLSNAAIQADIEAVVREMSDYCDYLRNAISGYYFE